MAEFFTEDYALAWAAILGIALFFPVRQLIWALYVRRAESRESGEVSEEQRQSLRKRAGFTAALVVFLFAVLYTNHLFKGAP
ncbi:MAG: hypothetical protein R3316_01560 [Rhodovibrionaceae bacterium]|nr:hypothetical protein [Rhodovibrionaceae bacterium]